MSCKVSCLSGACFLGKIFLIYSQNWEKSWEPYSSSLKLCSISDKFLTYCKLVINRLSQSFHLEEMFKNRLWLNSYYVLWYMFVLRNNTSFSGVCLCHASWPQAFFHTCRNFTAIPQILDSQASLVLGIHLRKLNCLLHKRTLHALPPCTHVTPQFIIWKMLRHFCLPNEMLRNTTQKWFCSCGFFLMGPPMRCELQSQPTFMVFSVWPVL